MNDVDQSTSLQGGGERLLLQDVESVLETQHLERYRYASQFAAGCTVLDVACGTGYGTRMLAKASAKRVLGADLSETAAQLARSTASDAKNASFLVADGTHLPLESGSLDLVVSFETVEHVPDDFQLVREVARLLRPGGTFIMSTPDRRPGSIKARLTRRPINPFHVREYTLGELLDLAEQFFEVEEVLAQHRVSALACIVPIQILVKGFCSLTRSRKLQEWKNDLYFGGTGPGLVRSTRRRSQVANFWVLRCRKRGGGRTEI